MKNILIILGILISFSSCAQKNKLKNFELISYEIEPNGNVDIGSYSRINENGKLDVYINGSRGKAYYSYELGEDELKSINKLSKQKLTEFVSKKQLEPNQGYAGNRNFISFQKNGEQNTLCYIVPFMNQEFTEVSNLLRDRIYAQKDSAKISEFKIDFEKLEKEIIKQDKIYDYLPKKTLPPPPIMPRK